MSRRSRRRGRRGVPWVPLLILAALCVILSAWWLLLHVGPLLGVLVIVAGAFYGGRRWERRQAGQAPAPKQTTARTPKQTIARPSGPLTSGLESQKRAEDARMRKNGWIAPAGQEADDSDPFPF